MNSLINVQKALLIISSVLVTLGLFATVILRYVFKYDLMGIDELLLIPIFVLYFLGGAHGSFEESHIRADILESYINSDRVKDYIRLFNQLFILVVGTIVVVWSTNYLLWSVSEGGSTQGWKIPLYIPHGTILLGFALMTFYTLIQFLQQIRGVIVSTKG